MSNIRIILSIVTLVCVTFLFTATLQAGTDLVLVVTGSLVISDVLEGVFD